MPEKHRACRLHGKPVAGWLSSKQKVLTMNVLWQMIVVFVPQKFRQLLTDLFSQPISNTLQHLLAWLGNMFRQLLALPATAFKHLLVLLRLRAQADDKTLEEKAQEIQDQMATTYSNIRYGLAIISFLFPLWLWGIGQWWYNIPLLGSMSAYYWEVSTDGGPIRNWLDSKDIPFLDEILVQRLGEAPMRSWFVGILFLLGFCLYLYKGFRKGENYLLNVAGIAAVGVALFPIPGNCADLPTCPDYGTLHALFAVTTFACIGLVAWFYAQYTLDLIRLAEQEKTAAYRWWYRIISLAFVLLILAAIVPSPLTYSPYRIFYLEWSGVWILACYWWVKSNELSEKRVEAAQAEQLEISVIRKGPRIVASLDAQASLGMSNRQLEKARP
jgi:hypothetical protein